MMMCSERLRLTMNYSDATEVYAQSVRKMADHMGFGHQNEVEVLRRACRAAWDATEKGRLALARHEANHGCDRPDFEMPAPVRSGAKERPRC